MRAISMKTLYNGRSLDRIEEGIETYSSAVGNRLTAIEAALEKIQDATEQILAAKNDINGNTKATQMGCASVNKPVINQCEVTTQIDWEPNNTSQNQKIQENREGQEDLEKTGEEDENKTTNKMGFINEAV